MPAPIPIILLKTKSSPSDPYSNYISSHQFPCGTPAAPIFVPVLKHQHVNLPRLTELITTDSISSEPNTPAAFSGLIITSQRAVEALQAVLSSLPTPPRLLTASLVYVVGPATSAAVVALGFPAQNVLGKECGNGSVLAAFIADHHASPQPLLFLNSEKRGDVIPGILAGRGVGLEELAVYETVVADGFGKEFTEVMERTNGGERWVVVFSPTGADVALEVLGRWGGDTFCASIGPTTEGYLVEKLGVRPDVVAGKPSPEGLWSGICEFRERRAGGD